MHLLTLSIRYATITPGRLILNNIDLHASYVLPRSWKTVGRIELDPRWSNRRRGSHYIEVRVVCLKKYVPNWKVHRAAEGGEVAILGFRTSRYSTTSNLVKYLENFLPSVSPSPEASILACLYYITLFSHIFARKLKFFSEE